MSQGSLMTSRQAARELDKTVTTIHRWAKSGRLKPVVVVPGYRGPLLFDPASVEALKQEASQ